MIQDCGNQQSMLSRECLLWRVRYFLLSFIVPLFFSAKTEVRGSKDVSTHGSHSIFELYDSKATWLNGDMETVWYNKIYG